jgi:hypothetical protein
MPARSMSPRSFYETLIAQMPAGLERAILRVLSFHIGKDQAIDKPDLLKELRRLGFGKKARDLNAQTSYETFERQARLCIVELRKHGHLICSSSGDSGYYIASTVEEYEEFAQVEYRSKIVDMSETLRAMDEGAKRVFHTPAAEKATQAGLF